MSPLRPANATLPHALTLRMDFFTSPPPATPTPGLTIEHFRRALKALSGLPSTDHGRPDHYPLRDEESHVITDAEWQTQRERIAAVTDAKAP